MAKNAKESERTRMIRETANAQRRREERAASRRRVLIQGSVIVAVLAVVGGGGFAVYASNQANDTLTVPSASGEIPVGDAQVPFEIGGTSIRVGADDAPVTVELVEDYSCPHCQEYEAEVGGTIEELVGEGAIGFEMTPVQIVTTYGVRAGSAAACVAVGSPEHWFDVSEALFERHDATTDGWRASGLRDAVEGLGVDDAATLDCIADGTYENWIEANTTAATDRGITSTPTLLIDGEVEPSLLSAEQLRARVLGG